MKSFNHKCRIITRRVAGHSALFFSYRANEDMAFEFSLLSEVGQPFIPSFEALLKERGTTTKVIEVNESPWLITVEADIAA